MGGNTDRYTPPANFSQNQQDQGGNQTMAAIGQNIVRAINALAQIMQDAFPAPLTGALVYDPPNLAAGDQDSTTITIAGIALGDIVLGASFSLDLQGITLSAYVSAANTVTVVFFNGTAGAIDLASGTIQVEVKT